MIRGPEAASAHEPLGADERAAEEARMGEQRDRPLGGQLKGEFQMILQVFANAGPIRDDLDPKRAQLRRRPHTRKLQELRRINRAATENDLAPRAHLPLTSATPVVDTDRAAPLEGDLSREGMNGDLKVRAFHRRPEIGVGGRPSHAVPHRHAERAKSLLPLAVEVIAHRVAGLPAGLDEGVIERIAFAPMRICQGSRASTVGVSSALETLGATEVGEHVSIAPPFRALLFPALEIERMPAHIDHAIDRRRAAQNLASRTSDAPTAEMWLWLATVTPIVGLGVHRD